MQVSSCFGSFGWLGFYFSERGDLECSFYFFFLLSWRHLILHFVSVSRSGMFFFTCSFSSDSPCKFQFGSFKIWNVLFTFFSLRRTGKSGMFLLLPFFPLLYISDSPVLCNHLFFCVEIFLVMSFVICDFGLPNGLLKFFLLVQFEFLLRSVELILFKLNSFSSCFG